MLAGLIPRDQRLVQWVCEGLSVQEVADRLEIDYDAAGRARLRALDRFQRAFRAATALGSGG